jgi:CheY-like chemotaxis protein
MDDTNDQVDILRTEPITSGNVQIPTFTGQVLVADDSLGNQVQTRILLNKLGFEVTLVDNGRQAINAIGNAQYDLIVMDILMLVKEGREVVQLLRSQSIYTPIIALTAEAIPQDRDKCMETGCHDFLSKPITSSELLKIIDKYLKPISTES